MLVQIIAIPAVPLVLHVLWQSGLLVLERVDIVLQNQM
jgi:hypothetical protein